MTASLALADGPAIGDFPVARPGLLSTNGEIPDATPRDKKNLYAGVRRLITEWNTYCTPIFSLTIVPPAR